VGQRKKAWLLSSISKEERKKETSIPSERRTSVCRREGTLLSSHGEKESAAIARKKGKKKNPSLVMRGKGGEDAVVIARGRRIKMPTAPAQVLEEEETLPSCTKDGGGRLVFIGRKKKDCGSDGKEGRKVVGPPKKKARVEKTL